MIGLSIFTSEVHKGRYPKTGSITGTKMKPPPSRGGGMSQVSFPAFSVTLDKTFHCHIFFYGQVRSTMKVGAPTSLNQVRARSQPLIIARCS